MTNPPPPPPPNPGRRPNLPPPPPVPERKPGRVWSRSEKLGAAALGAAVLLLLVALGSLIEPTPDRPTPRPVSTSDVPDHSVIPIGFVVRCSDGSGPFHAFESSYSSGDEALGTYCSGAGTATPSNLVAVMCPTGDFEHVSEGSNTNAVARRIC